MDENALRMYPNDFSNEEKKCIPGDLTTFCHTLKKDDKIAKLDGTCGLARVMS